MLECTLQFEHYICNIPAYKNNLPCSEHEFCVSKICQPPPPKKNIYKLISYFSYFLS